MTRLAKGRDTHLLPQEIAAEALRQFDAGSEAPSIRQLATALGVAPSAIYHHFPSRSAIVRSAVEIVWEESQQELLAMTPDPFGDDPAEVLVALGIAIRRAFGRHYRIAPWMAATPQGNAREVAGLHLMANVLERMGLHGEDASAAFHAYASFTFGAVLFAATRRITNERMAAESKDDAPAEPAYPIDPDPDGGTLPALQRMVQISTTDPARDEELFALTLRRLVEGFPSGRTRPVTA